MKNRSPWAWIPTLYFAEGLPNVIVMTVAVTMYMQLGLSDTEIGLYTGWLALPWVVKPLWSPFIDVIRTKRWWVLAMQILLGASLAGVAFTLNAPWWFQGTLFCFFLMAFASATHDVAADGFYMIQTRPTRPSVVRRYPQHVLPTGSNLRHKRHYRTGRCAAGSLPQQDCLYLEPSYSMDWQASSSPSSSTTASRCQAKSVARKPTHWKTILTQKFQIHHSSRSSPHSSPRFPGGKWS